METSRRRWVRVILLGFALCTAKAFGQCLPWQPTSQKAKTAYMAIEHHMQQGAYSVADSLLRRAIPVFSADDSDQLLFLCTWAQELTATARYREAIGCLQFCQTHFAATLTEIPHARAFLIECYADIATEFQLTNLFFRS